MSAGSIMDEKITLHLGDMSQSTLLSLQADLQKYAHLSLYKDVYEKVCEAVMHLKKLEGVTAGHRKVGGDQL